MAERRLDQATASRQGCGRLGSELRPERDGVRRLVTDGDRYSWRGDLLSKPVGVAGGVPSLLGGFLGRRACARTWRLSSARNVLLLGERDLGVVSVPVGFCVVRRLDTISANGGEPACRAIHIA